MMQRTLKEWERYEETARQILDRLREHFGLTKVEGKQTLVGVTGAEWELDAKGVAEGTGGIVVIECRRTKNRQSQAKLGSMAFTISDTGAERGIIVSMLPLQAGAAKIAAAKNIISVVLDERSTPTDFALRFLNNLFLGVSAIVQVDAIGSLAVQRGCFGCGAAFASLGAEKLCPTCTASNLIR